MMRAEQAEIEAAYEQGDMVTVCWEPGCCKHRLYYWEENTWVEHQKREKYQNFTHSICDEHYRCYQEELDQLIAEEEAAVLGQSVDRASVPALAAA